MYKVKTMKMIMVKIMMVVTSLYKVNSLRNIPRNEIMTMKMAMVVIS